MKKHIQTVSVLLLMILALVGGCAKMDANATENTPKVINSLELSIRPETAYSSDKSITHATEVHIKIPNTPLTTNQFGRASIFDNSLAKVGAVLSQSCYSKAVKDDDQPGYTNKDLRILGYDDIQLYNFDLKADGEYNSANNIAFTIAHKIVKIDGKNANSFAIVMRGTPMSKEWNGDFKYGLGEASGYDKYWQKNIFSLAKVVHETFSEYCIAHEESIKPQTTNKIFVTGHSRGGGAAEGLGYLFDKDIQHNEGMLAAHSRINANEQPVNKDNVFVYAFAPTQSFNPTVEGTSDTTESKLQNQGAYNNIQDVINPLDFVPTLPIQRWGYQHVGNVHNLFDINTLTPKLYAQFRDTYMNVETTGNNAQRNLYDKHNFADEIGYGPKYEFKTLGERLKRDESGMTGINNAMHDTCPDIMNYDTPEPITFNVASGISKTEWFSEHDFFASYAKVFTGGQSFAHDKTSDTVQAISSDVPQTSKRALEYQELLKHLPTANEGPNIGQHLCTTYIAWLYTQNAS
ncbi:MAG: lipase family protein [Lactobacillaceae bacterium]|nr:lipase family protein [Lactobacillaceae bacterium]